MHIGTKNPNNSNFADDIAIFQVSPKKTTSKNCKNNNKNKIPNLIIKINAK
jgi:hypothetical protein